VIELRSVAKVYRAGGAPVTALHDVNLSVAQGEFLAVTGPSASGKSTLLNLIGCLDRPSSGYVMFDGEDTTELNDSMLSQLRNRSIGFIFQTFNLIPELTIAENVELPLVYAGVRRGRGERAALALAQVGMSGRMHARAGTLSGGEQQRVAIARALVNDPELIVADEPTGSIDAASAVHVLGILKELHRQSRTVVLVTHNVAVASAAQRTLQLRNGTLTAPALEQVRTPAASQVVSPPRLSLPDAV
jgi:putative ABC transport system ATP-binding protein